MEAPTRASVPFLITHAMKDALRARGHSDEEITQLTPEEAHKILATPDVSAVREFLATIVAQARAATKHLTDEGKDAGLLQMLLVHPLDEDTVVPYRYALDDADLIERMTRDAVSASEAGHNVYIEARTVRRGLRGKQRGELTDTAAVFALVVDSDGDKNASWTATVPVSLTVETSPGNAHCWLFFERALDPDTGKRLGELLRAASGADSDTGNICQPYRVAGTVNYPGKKKLERGRIVTWTRVLEFDPEVLWTPERFEQDFAVTRAGGNGGGTSQSTLGPDESCIPADTLREIQAQDPGKRGTRFWNVMIVLKKRGFTIDGIVALFEKYPDGIAAKFRGRLRDQVETVWAKLGNGGSSKPGTLATIKLLSKAEFLDGYIPPDYIVEGVLQRRFVYSLTAVTGHGKTAMALLLARAVACTDLNTRFGPHAVERGKVVYFIGENPEDVRCRVIGDEAKRSDDAEADRIHFIEGVFDIAGLREQLVAAIEKLGGIDLVIVDTSAAYFLQQDENSNTQIGEHARMLRTLTTLPGGPCVIPLCHPIKHVTDPSQLLPRGGGAFLNEMDGNLTLWLHDEDLVTLHHNKLRGPGFEPITFKLEKITTEKLVDRKDRLMPTVHAIAISEQEEEEQEASAEADEDKLLEALSGPKPLPIADLARICDWLLANGKPHKSKTFRVLDRLVREKLVKKVRGRRYRLTEEGRKVIGTNDEDNEIETTIEDRGGVVSKKPFHALKGMKKGPTVPCAYCSHTGDVFGFADSRQPKGQRHYAHLHEECAEAFFTGKPKPANGGSGPPESPFH